MKSDEEIVEGDPWSVLPVKTAKFAKECKNIVLSNRGINKLKNFEFFDNLEALWLNERIVGLDNNFRIKLLCIQKNRITTLEGSLSKMKFLRTLYVNDNKLRNLDKNLEFLKYFSFLEELNLFGNPLAEEPEYRYRTIFALPSVMILDRHKVNQSEKLKSEEVVKEFNDPLSKKNAKKTKKLKVSQAFSITERELFSEAELIMKKRKQIEKDLEKKQQDLINKEKFPDKYMPFNKNFLKNVEKYYISEKDFKCKELENNEIRRIFNYFDKTASGFIQKSDIKFCFMDIRSALYNNKIELNDKLFTNSMLGFYSKSPELVDIKDIKQEFYKLLYDTKNNIFDPDKKIKDLDYLKNLTLSETLNGSPSIQSHSKLLTREPGRNDVFVLQTFTNFNNPVEVILNENKLAKAYK